MYAGEAMAWFERMPCFWSDAKAAALKLAPSSHHGYLVSPVCAAELSRERMKPTAGPDITLWQNVEHLPRPES